MSKKNRQHSDQKTEEQTTQWPKEKVQKDKQRSTKHTHKSKDRVTRTPLKTNNDLQNIAQKTKDLVTRTPLKTNNDLQNIHIKLKIK